MTGVAWVVSVSGRRHRSGAGPPSSSSRQWGRSRMRSTVAPVGRAVESGVPLPVVSELSTSSPRNNNFSTSDL